MLQVIEQKLAKFWDEFSGEAKADLERALAEAKAEEEKILPVVEAFAGQIGREVLADVAPEVKAVAEQLLAQLLADLGVALGKAPEPPAPA